MAAIIGLEADVLEQLCGDASEAGLVSLANLNSPTQIVVSGEEAGVGRLMELASEAGAAKTVRLQVGAAFHSELMKPVQASLAETMDELDWSDLEVPLVANFSGAPVADAAAVREALIEQIASPVRWVDCVRTLVDAGCTDFLELGPGRVLGGLVRQIAGSDVQRRLQPTRPRCSSEFAAQLLRRVPAVELARLGVLRRAPGLRVVGRDVGVELALISLKSGWSRTASTASAKSSSVST